MLGIIAYGRYLPYYRLAREKIPTSIGDARLTGAKAVANFDEDSVSMGVNAALECLLGRVDTEISACFFATMTSPYEHKEAASTIVKALNLNHFIRTADFSGFMRASASALLAAFDFVQVQGDQALVVSADCVLGAPHGGYEQISGDAGAALLLGQGDDVIAKLVGQVSFSQEQLSYWRNKGETFVQTWEERFVQQVYIQTVQVCVKEIMTKYGLKPSDFAKVILPGPNIKALNQVARVLGFDRKQIADPLIEVSGMPGTAQAVIGLGTALAKAQAGERILLVSYGEGCDAFVFEVTDQITQFQAQQAGRYQGRVYNRQLDYLTYLKWKNIYQAEPARRPATPRPSVPAMYRNYDQNLALCGSRCIECGAPQFPKQRVCIQCQAKDRMEDYRFYGRSAKVTTFTVDYLAASPSPPTVIAVVDFEGGGRILCELTDCEASRVEIGMEVVMTFRHLYEAGGIHNYFWKAKPKMAGGLNDE